MSLTRGEGLTPGVYRPPRVSLVSTSDSTTLGKNGSGYNPLSKNDSGHKVVMGISEVGYREGHCPRRGNPRF